MAGVWFDEMTVGQIFEHPIRRTVTETDNVLFTAMTHNPASCIWTRNICAAPILVSALSTAPSHWA